MIKSPGLGDNSPGRPVQKQPPKDDPLTPLSFPSHLRNDLRSRLQLDTVWGQRLGRALKSVFAPRTVILGFIGLSAYYAFVIGRPRYTATSEFYIQQPAPLNSAVNTIFGTPVGVPQVMNSLVDGQYLKVYLGSPGIKNKLYPKPEQLEQIYAPQAPDVFAGLSSQSTANEQVDFFRRQISIQPQPMSGGVIIRTHGFQPEQALKLNQSLLGQAQKFINEVNQSISADQKLFAENELELAEKDLTTAKKKLQDFQDQYGQLSPEIEQQTTSTFIAQLESNLVDLKVELATLKRRYIDADSPEVAYLTDQVQELERQIAEERKKAVGAGGRDLNKLTSEAETLKADVDFAARSLEAARIAVDNSRRESQRQLKFVVMLSQPQLPTGEDMNWRWQFFLASVGIVIVGWAVGGFVLAAVRKQ